MNKIKQVLLDCYCENKDNLSEDEVNEFLGTMLGIGVAKAVAPLFGALGTKLVGAGALKAGATALGASKVATVVGATAGAVGDLVAGSKIAHALHGKPDTEIKVRFKDKNNKWQYRVTKAGSVKEAIKTVAKENNIHPNDIEEVKVHKVRLERERVW